MLDVGFLVRDFDLWRHKQEGALSNNGARYKDEESHDVGNDFGDFRKGLDGGGAGQGSRRVFGRLRPKEIPSFSFLLAVMGKEENK